MADKTILFEVEFDAADALKKAAEYQDQINKLNEEKKNLDKTDADYSKRLIAINQQIKSAQTEQKKYTKTIELATNAQNANAKSIDQLKNELALATKNLNEMENALQVNADGSVELTDEFIAQAKAVKELRDLLQEAQQAYGNNALNVGKYKESIGEAFKLQNIFAKDGLKNLIGEFDNLRKALLKNPLLLLVAGLVAVGAALKELFDKFAETKEGSEGLAQAGASLQRVLSPLTKIIFNIFGALVEFTTAILSGVEAVGEFIGVLDDSSESAAGVTANLQKLRDAQKELEIESKKLRKEEEQLKQLRDDESKTLDERIAANEKLGKIELERVGKLIANQDQVVKQIEERNKQLGKEQVTQEQIDELLEARLRLEELNEESIAIQTEQIVQQNGLLKTQVELKNQISAATLEQDILQGKIAEGSKEELAARKQLLQDQLELQLKGVAEGSEQEKLLRIQTNNAILALDKQFNQSQLDNYKTYIAEKEAERQKQLEKEKQDRQKEQADELARLEFLALSEKENTRQRVEAEKEVLRTKFQFELENETLTNNEILLKRQELQIALQTLDLNQENFELEQQNKRRAAILKDFEDRVALKQQEDDLDKKRVEDQLAREKQIQDLRLQVANSSIDAIQAVVGEETAAGKAIGAIKKTIALAEVAINLQTELSAIAASYAKLGPVGTALSVIRIATAVARGAQIVSSIKNTKFAEGGYTGGGFGGPDETGFKPAGIVHEGEYVMPKRVLQTAKGRVLMNQAERLRLGKYADGGFVTSASTANIDSNATISAQFAQIIAALPAPVVDVREIISKTAIVSAVETKASI